MGDWAPYVGKGTLVDRTDFSTTPGKRDDLVNWFRAHPWPGTVAAEPYAARDGVVRLVMEPKSPSRPANATIWVSMVQVGAIVRYRIDAQAAFS